MVVRNNDIRAEVHSGHTLVYIDILLQKAPNIEDDITEGVIELKYIPRGKFTQQRLETEIADAKAQLSQYGIGQSEMGVVVVFGGWEMVWCERV